MAADGMTIAWAVDGSGDPGEGSAAIGTSRRALAAPDDRVLIERAQGGDREAFEALVHRYDRDVLRIALNILHKPEDARDVYQEAFLKIYKNLPRFRFECSFYTWMYRIVTNVCLDHPPPPQQPAGRSGAGTRDQLEWGRFRRVISSTGSRTQGAASEPGAAPDGTGNRPSGFRPRSNC